MWFIRIINVWNDYWELGTNRFITNLLNLYHWISHVIVCPLKRIVYIEKSTNIFQIWILEYKLYLLLLNCNRIRLIIEFILFYLSIWKSILRKRDIDLWNLLCSKANIKLIWQHTINDIGKLNAFQEIRRIGGIWKNEQIQNFLLTMKYCGKTHATFYV